MKSKKALCFGIVSTLAMVWLVLDSKTAIDGAAEGVMLCITTLIPSLFPFFVLTNHICNAVGTLSRLLRPLGKICNIPTGAEPLLLIGWLGGYPVGAKALNSAAEQGALPLKSANTLLGFLNNPGPAFIFGIAAVMFDDRYIPWVLWGIVLISSVLTGVLSGQKDQPAATTFSVKPSGAMADSLKAMAAVCGWVIMMRTVLKITERWFLWMLPANLKILITGMIEISNGFLLLGQLQDRVIKFTVAAVLLSSGGLCVALQTAAVTPMLNIKYYLSGKLLQTAIASLLSQIVSLMLFRQHIPYVILISIWMIGAILILRKYRYGRKIVLEKSRHMIYNNAKKQKMR